LVIRNRIIPIINNLSSFFFITIRLIKDCLLKITKQFIKNNKNIIFTRVDKDNATVTLDRDDYYEKITRVLQDTNTYVKI